jgi:hypothetical protein
MPEVASSSAQMLLPCVGLVAVTAGVWAKLYVDRLSEMSAKKMKPQALATRRDARALLANVQAADNFNNLLEMPVLFYTFCLTATVTNNATQGVVAAAWAYVGLRAAHSVVHCSFNHVLTRFTVYAASSVLLFGMWARLGAKLLSQSA